MSSYPKLNFPAVKLRASRRGERTLVWDDLRAMWLVLTPEEWVRRHLIAYLETGCGAARRRTRSHSGPDRQGHHPAV